MFFFFNDTATTEIYTLSLHDALPIYCATVGLATSAFTTARSVLGSRPTIFACTRVPSLNTASRTDCGRFAAGATTDRKSTRLNSSHANISYAVFCLKKKNHI